jgi:hypothetical protein
LWIRFNLPCDGNTQRKLHRIFRHEVKDWEKINLVKGAVLTYHFKTPSVAGDSLYVCLDIPKVAIPNKREVDLSKEVIGQIPSDIISKINQVCRENQIELGILDYEFDIITDKSWRYYRNAPTEEIIRFASIGTKIACELLDKIDNQEIILGNHKELADIILSRLRGELGENYFWMREAFHFVCNPMLFDDSYLWTLTTAQ